MHESLGDRRKEVQGARFIYFVKQLHNNLSRVRRLPQGSLFHELVTVSKKEVYALHCEKVTMWTLSNVFGYTLPKFVYSGFNQE